MAEKLAYEDRKIAFEKQVKLAIAKEFSAGNKALPLDGGFPHDYGFLSEEDMAEILRKAAAGIDVCLANCYAGRFHRFSPCEREPSSYSRKHRIAPGSRETIGEAFCDWENSERFLGSSAGVDRISHSA